MSLQQRTDGVRGVGVDQQQAAHGSNDRNAGRFSAKQGQQIRHIVIRLFELQLRLKYAYEDYARYRWDEDLLLSEQWINQVSPEDFLEWVRWHPNPDWDSKVATFLQSPEFKERVYLLEAKLEADASEVFRYNTEKRR